jgi:DNA-binding transcriptional LysR family regulator
MRAIEYFNRAAEGGSFAAAARAFDVTTPAVTHLIGALESALGTVLFHRTNRGLKLTADGERYYEGSRRLTTDLRDLEQQLGTRGSKPRGTLTVGMRYSIGQYCVVPRVARFLARHPDVELVTKPIATLSELDEKKLDLALMVGWPPERDLVIRPLFQTRVLVVASPGYWQQAGRPQRPEDLRQHHCLIHRGSGGALIDRWIMERGGERRTVDVQGRFLSDDATLIMAAVLAGAGVARQIDVTVLDSLLPSGAMVPCLPDWQSTEAPIVFAAYRARQRQSVVVRAFVDFLVEVFDEIGRLRSPAQRVPVLRAARPDWDGRTDARLSAFAARRERRGD